jgi:spermidine synthase
MAGVASLFTREFFEAARARLKPDGLLCQWAHTYDISRQDLQSIAERSPRCSRKARSGWSAEAIYC